MLDNADLFVDMGSSLRSDRRDFFAKNLANAMMIANSMGENAVVWDKSEISDEVIETLQAEGMTVSERASGGYDIDWTDVFRGGLLMSLSAGDQNLVGHSNAIYSTKKLRRRRTHTELTGLTACQNMLCIQYIANPTITQWLNQYVRWW